MKINFKLFYNFETFMTSLAHSGCCAVLLHTVDDEFYNCLEQQKQQLLSSAFESNISFTLSVFLLFFLFLSLFLSLFLTFMITYILAVFLFLPI